MKPFRRRVTFDDVDFARVPFYGRYFSWVSEAESEALNQNGLGYTELVGQRGIGFPIVDAHCHYHRPLAIDQEFDVHVSIRNLSLRGFELAFEIYREADGVRICDGALVRRFVDTATFRGTVLPPDLLERFKGLEQVLGTTRPPRTMLRKNSW
jgi:YbgC/YbaW family acyl-CoA thioester hydrolase